MVNETAKEGFRRLAFGGIHDAVRLLFCEDVNPRTLKNMDLFAVSEIRRPKNGGMEIRFFDRIEALRLLSELETSGTGAQALLSAIPLPDPIRERARKLVPFDEADFHPDGRLVEAAPGHFVLEGGAAE
mgnify:CR=1 FL=1